MKKYIIFLLMIFAFTGKAQTISLVTESDIPGLTVTGNDVYAGMNLNDYLPGSADLYLEYGFSKLFVTGYTLDKDKATLEVYKMEDAPSAFGIYSLSVSKCNQRNLFGTFSCSTPYQIAAVSGNLFLYASNPSGAPSAQALCEQLVKLVIDKNPQETWYAPPLVQSAKAAPYVHTLRFIKGPLGLRKAVPYWTGLFENLLFDMYTITISERDFNAVVARITFPDQSTLSSFIMKAGLNVNSTTGTPGMTGHGLYRSWYKITETRILFMESNSGTLNLKDFLPTAPEIK
jgi:hypothetical protein